MIVVGVLRNTSNEFFVEYNEMSVIQDFKLSLYQLQLQVNKHDLVYNHEQVFNNENKVFLGILIHNSREKLDECLENITKSHDHSILETFPEVLNRIELLSTRIFSFGVNENEKRELILHDINKEINEAIKQVDIIVIETQLETQEYYRISKTVFNHSSLVIFFLGIIILLIIIITGMRFINNLTQPINNFVSTTKKIAAGHRGIKVKLNTNDEFEILAGSFNNMLNVIEQTTVTKTYLNNILNNMFDALVVTDSQLKILSVNNAVAQLLGNKKSWYEGKPLSSVLEIDDSQFSENTSLDYWKDKIQSLNFFIDQKGDKIPELISCSILKNESEDIQEGLVIVGHNLTSKLKMEDEIEKTRKQRQVDINEAQEDERMRIATDIHDGLGQMLSAISYSINTFQNVDSLNKNQRDDLIEKIQDQINTAIRESKNLAHNLIPIVLKDFGLVIAIKNLVERLNEANDTELFFNAYDFDKRVDPRIEKALYRICQESLNNILKHSDAESANVQLFKQEDIVVLVIDDDGKGFDLKTYDNQMNKGIGLISMKERVMSFGGTISIDSQLNDGTEIIVEIPIK